jgi:hypothetical protein
MGGRAVLVVANLGTTPVSGVALSSQGEALPPGRYLAEGLLDRAGAETLRVGADGRMQGYVPLQALRPLEVGVYQLVLQR